MFTLKDYAEGAAKAENAQDLDAYQNHPEHLKTGDFIVKVRIDRRVVDYEV